MRISLIGMSGSGKSTWSAKLRDLGFIRYCCDDLIAERLSHKLVRPDGTLMQLGEWMGFPYEPQYEERESDYLACEMQVVAEILDCLEGPEKDSGERVVVDTTGSVIYLGERILDRLRRNTTMVLLSTPPEVLDLMLNAYIVNKRPVLWRDKFKIEPNESKEEALARCYPGLLASRRQLYEKYADVTIDYRTLNQDGFGIADFLERVECKAVKNPLLPEGHLPGKARNAAA